MKRILKVQESMEAILRRDPNSSINEEDVQAFEPVLIAQDFKSKTMILAIIGSTLKPHFQRNIPCYICGEDADRSDQKITEMCRFCGQSVCRGCYHDELVTKDDPLPICNDCWEAGGDLAKELAETKEREKEAWIIWASKIKKGQ